MIKAENPENHEQNYKIKSLKNHQNEHRIYL